MTDEHRARTTWRKSSHSNVTDCVEVAVDPEDGVQLRSSHEPDGHVLHCSRPEWLAFVDGTKGGQLDG